MVDRRSGRHYTGLIIIGKQVSDEERYFVVHFTETTNLTYGTL